MNNFLLFMAALLVLALSALFAAPWFVDWNDYRSVFEQQASRLVGREVNVGGDVSLTFLPAPVLRFENINVADEQGGFDTPFLSARSLTVWLSAPPLLRGVVEASDVALEQPILNLQIGPEGRGNWSDVGRPDIVLPFMPREVALDSFRIMDATVMLSRGTQQPYLTLDHLDGELSARSLSGPFKFAGTFQTAGGEHELRLSTGRRAQDGSVRLKAVLSNDAGAASYTIDGDLSAFAAAPRFSGDFQARFLDAGADAGEAAQSPAPEQPQYGPVPEEAPPVLIKAKVDAGPVAAKFTGIEVAIRRSNKPQTITGALDIAYAGELDVDGSLSSRWLDIDTLIPPVPDQVKKDTPVEMATWLAGRLLGFTASLRSLRLGVTVEQTVLAGDLLHDVAMDLAGGRGSVAIERFAARLPGDAEFSLNGELVARDGAPAFTGSAAIVGGKVIRLLGWAGLETGSAVAAQEGDFSLRGALSAAPGAVALEEATGQLFGSRFSGALRYSAGKRRRFDLTLKSDRLDMGRIGGSWIDRLTIPALLRIGEAGDGDRKDASVAGWFEGAEAQLDIDIGAVTLPGMGENALTAGIDIDGDDVSVRRLRLVSNEGLRLEAKGSLTGLDETPSGSIELTANADSIPGVRALARLLELDDIANSEEPRLRALTPAALTGSIRSAGGGRRGLAVETKGRLGGNDLSVTASLDGRLAAWKDAGVTLDGTLRSASARHLLAQLSGSVRQQNLALFKDSPGIVDVKASGVPSEGLRSTLDFSGGGVTLIADGTVTAREDEFDFAGRAKLGADNGAALLTLAGGHLSPGHAGERLDLAGTIKSSRENYEISKLSGKLGPIDIRGDGRLDLSSERPRVELKLVTSAASLPSLFEPLIGWNAPSASVPGVVRGVSRSETFWPDEVLDTELLSSFDGALKLTSKTIRLTGPLMLTDGSFAAKLDNGVLKIEHVEGKLRGGTVAGSAEFEARSGGLSFKAGAGARGLQLNQLMGGDGLAQGKMDVELEVTGQGLSPRGLAAGLSGKGRLTFSEGKIARLEPLTPKKAAAGLGKDDASGEDELIAAIRKELVKGSFAFRPFEADIRVRNGVARVEKVQLRDPSGSAVVTSFLEFATLRLDSEWMLVSGKAEDEEAPRISLAFAGPLADVGAMKPDIDAGALRRHATIRRMERDVERLENLEVPGAPKKRKESNQEKPAAASPSPEAAPPRAAAIPAPPSPAHKPEPVAPVRETPPAAEPQGDSVLSRPLPPAAPPSRESDTPPPLPVPAPQAQPRPDPLPWRGQQSFPQQQQQWQPPQADAYRPPEPPVQVAPQPAPQPQPRNERRPEPWNPFRQDGL